MKLPSVAATCILTSVLLNVSSAALFAIVTLLPITSAAARKYASDVEIDLPVSRDINNSLYSVLNKSLAGIGPTTKSGDVWVKVDHSEDNTVSARQSMLLININCVEMSFTIDQTVSYNPSRQITDAVFHETYVRKKATPGTTFYSVLEYACNDRNYIMDAITRIEELAEKYKEKDSDPESLKDPDK